MKHRALGSTGVEVSPLCLRTMMFGAWGNPDHEESIRIIHRALDAGINVVDTADVYSGGESDEIVGKALRGRRDDGRGSPPDDHERLRMESRNPRNPRNPAWRLRVRRRGRWVPTMRRS